MIPTNGSGHGSGHGYGHGFGNGDGDGYGYGYGYGYGDGFGHGYRYGYGYGYGDGFGHGYRYGAGYGNGNGYGYGAGNGASTRPHLLTQGDPRDLRSVVEWVLSIGASRHCGAQQQHIGEQHMNAPMIRTLADKAMLVRLSRGVLTTDITDAAATKIVEQQTGVARAGRYKKKILADSAKLKDVQDKYLALYTYHQKHTLPWIDAGPRLLPAKLYMEYTTELRKLRVACDNSLALLKSTWSTEIDNDRARLGSMFNIGDYPADPGDRFYHKVDFLPVPTAADFRVEIDPDDIASLEAAVAEAERGATRTVVEQLIEPLRHAAQKLTVPIGARGAVFRDSLLENIAEAVERLPKLDISGDPRIQRAIAETQALVAAYYGKQEALRADPVLRAGAARDTQATVDNIMKNLGGLLA